MKKKKKEKERKQIKIWIGKVGTCEPFSPVSFTFTFGEFNNARVSATLPVLAAKCRAVVPYLFFLVGSAPFSNRNFAVDAILYLLQTQNVIYFTQEFFSSFYNENSKFL